jgi:hypothetical protein
MVRHMADLLSLSSVNAIKSTGAGFARRAAIKIRRGLLSAA